MYAIVRTGGKQYQVSEGERLRVEKLAGEIGDSIDLEEILMLVDGEEIKVGQPLVDGAKISAKIVEQGKAKKVLVYKKKRRKGYEVKNGHRQLYTSLEITTISA